MASPFICWILLSFVSHSIHHNFQSIYESERHTMQHTWRLGNMASPSLSSSSTPEQPGLPVSPHLSLCLADCSTFQIGEMRKGQSPKRGYKGPGGATLEFG